MAAMRLTILLLRRPLILQYHQQLRLRSSTRLSGQGMGQGRES